MLPPSRAFHQCDNITGEDFSHAVVSSVALEHWGVAASCVMPLLAGTGSGAWRRRPAVAPAQLLMRNRGAAPASGAVRGGTGLPPAAEVPVIGVGAFAVQ
ncbi:hypothetical protein PLESTM_000750300, partial [Pleodorina starrii]